MLRSAGAVLAGFVVMAITVMIGTIALAALLIPGGLKRMRSPEATRTVPAGYLRTNLLLSLIAAVLGGWLTARIAGTASIMHALALAVLISIMGIVSARQTSSSGIQSGQPTWYPAVITALGVVGALIGGMLSS